MAKQVSPGVLALRKVVDDVYKEAREAKARGELVGWSSSKFPCEFAEAFGLHVMYPENQAAGIAANRYGKESVQPCAENGGQSSSLVFYGSSFICDETGGIISCASRDETDIILSTFELDELRGKRLEWGVFRDRRPEMYGEILK